MFPIQGNQPDGTLYVDDVFSTYLYTGNGSTQTITNGIDLAGKGGLVWIKYRTGAGSEPFFWYDTVRGVDGNGAGLRLASDRPDEQLGGGSFLGVNSYTSTGFGIGNGYVGWNQSAIPYGSWTFRKQPKFFDVVTYTGNGTTQNVAHNLGSVPGCIIVKCTSQTKWWAVQHRSVPASQVLQLNATSAAVTDNAFNSTYPTATTFSVAGADQNINGATYVAYLFAHDTTTDGLIQCGSYTGNGSPPLNVTLGWEPQFVIIKNASATANWAMYDVMRGMPTGNFSAVSALLQPNLSNAENLGANRINPTATGFTINEADAQHNVNGNTFIYLAIRRPNKPPTSGTEVYNAAQYTAPYAGINYAGFPVDMSIVSAKEGYSHGILDRARGMNGNLLLTNDASYVEATGLAARHSVDNMTGVKTDGGNSNYYGTSGWHYVWHMFRRAPGFFDVVCYTGNGVSNTSYTHNLSAIPELAFIKRRNTTGEWWVCRMNATTVDTAQLQSTAAFALGTTYGGSSIMKAAPTSTTFNLGNYADVNASGGTYVAYLFASLPGISKVGSYTGNGSSQTINCGFSVGARLVLIKRTDSTGDWFVWDSTRGIVAGNDPHLSLNTTAAEVTTDDSIDPDNSGFIVNQLAATNINVTSATYIFLALS